MAQLPKLSRFQTEDFGKDQRKWIGKLLQPLNSFMQSVVSALDKNLTVNQNLQGEIKSITVRGGTTTSFKYTPTQRPQVVMIGRIIDRTGSIISLPVSCVDWSDDGAGNITVQALPNLISGQDYTVTFMSLS